MIKFIRNLTDKIREKLSDKKGQGMVEYALVLAAVAVIALYVLMGTDNNNSGLKTAVSDAFSNAASKITDAQNGITTSSST